MVNVSSFTKSGKVNGDIALEIEMEGTNLPRFEGGNKYWSAVGDGSLRANGIEYVMKGPVPYNEVVTALSTLKTALASNSAVVDNSYRAGIHVHVNVQEMNFTQVINYVCVYLLLEEVLIDWCAPYRKGNHFCLRGVDSEFLIDRLSAFVSTGDLSILKNDEIRYSGVNLLSVLKYGSLEFRALESTTDFEKVKMWVDILWRMKNFSKRYSDPTKIMADFSMHGPRTFASLIIGPHWQYFVSDDIDSKVMSGMELAQDVAFARSWGVNYNIFEKSAGVFN